MKKKKIDEESEGSTGQLVRLYKGKLSCLWNSSCSSGGVFHRQQVFLQTTVRELRGWY
jgi:hypothetical protein